MSGNNTFEKSDFADRRFSFILETVMVGCSLRPCELRNMKQMVIHFFFKKSFSFPEIEIGV